MLLTHIQKLPAGNQSGLDKYLFGQAATLVVEDLQVMAVLGAVVVTAVLLFYKELKLLSFDPGFGASLGLPMRWMEVLLTLLLVVVVVVGLQTVGVVLIVATLITPAAAARQWTDRLGAMVLLSAGIGAARRRGGLARQRHGAAPAHRARDRARLQLRADRLPAARAASAASSGDCCGSGRWRTRIRRENLLKDLWLAGERRLDFESFLSSPYLMGVRGQSAGDLARSAQPLIRAGLAERQGDALRLTPAGQAEAESVVRKHRLWEVYLTRRLELPSDHVHRDAEAMEHALSEAAVADLEEALGFPESDPHGQADPATEARVNPTLVILVAASCVAASCALIGTFLVLRKMALLGDAISHAVLPGIVIAFLVTGDRAPLPMVIGAGALGVLTVLLVELFNRSRRLREDASIGVVFPALFSLGVILISRYAAQVDLDLDCVLYGEIAYAPWDTLMIGGADVGPKALWVNGVVLLIDLLFVLLFYKELKVSTFDAGLAASLGVSPAPDALPADERGLRHGGGGVRVRGRDPGGGHAGGAAGHRLPAHRTAGPDAGPGRGPGYRFPHSAATRSPAGGMPRSRAAWRRWRASLFVAALLFSPGHGLVSRLVQLWRMSRRLSGQLLLLHLQKGGEVVPVAKLEQRFGWSRGRLQRVLNSLTRSGWIESEGEGLRLTAQGAEVLETTGRAQLAHKL